MIANVAGQRPRARQRRVTNAAISVRLVTMSTINVPIG